jgi:hypothetical protein
MLVNEDFSGKVASPVCVCSCKLLDYDQILLFDVHGDKLL